MNQRVGACWGHYANQLTIQSTSDKPHCTVPGVTMVKMMRRNKFVNTIRSINRKDFDGQGIHTEMSNSYLTYDDVKYF